MKRVYSRLAAALAVLVLHGCGPMYETVYTLTPPPGRVGLECIESCEEQQKECELYLERREAECEERQQARMARCEERVQHEKNRGARWTECGKTESCVKELSKCEAPFRSCYAACGGSVESKRECTAFCD